MARHKLFSQSVYHHCRGTTSTRVYGETPWSSDWNLKFRAKVKVKSKFISCYVAARQFEIAVVDIFLSLTRAIVASLAFINHARDPQRNGQAEIAYALLTGRYSSPSHEIEATGTSLQITLEYCQITMRDNDWVASAVCAKRVCYTYFRSAIARGRSSVIWDIVSTLIGGSSIVWTSSGQRYVNASRDTTTILWLISTIASGS